MKRLVIIIAVLISTQLRAQDPSPKLRLLAVDSSLNNTITSFYLSQVGISGYYDNLKHIPSITINSVTHSVIDGQSWTIPTTGGTVTSITPGYGHVSLSTITTTGNTTIDTSSMGLQTVLNYFPKGDTRYLRSTSPANSLSKSSNYTVLSTDFAAVRQPVILLSVDASGGSNSQTLPTTGLSIGAVIKIIKTDATANAVTIVNLNYDNKIDRQYWLKELIWDGSNWRQN